MDGRGCCRENCAAEFIQLCRTSCVPGPCEISRFMCRLRSAINAQKPEHDVPAKGISARSARRRRNVPSSSALEDVDAEGRADWGGSKLFLFYCRNTYNVLLAYKNLRARI